MKDFLTMSINPNDTPQPRPLAGVRVVELASMVFAPSACAAMADFGAEVIKVEPPGTGDLNRHYHKLPGMPVSDLPYAFQMDNRNKRSIALDLKTELGSEALRKLILKADVLVTNYRPAALAKLSLTYADLSTINPRLIYALASGWGEEGDARDQPGYDSVCYWAASAIESQMFPIDGWLGPIPFGAGDHPSGTALFGAIMLGRFALGFVSVRLGNRRLVRAGLVVAFVGALLFAAPGLPHPALTVMKYFPQEVG